jgi:hypothetical protein
MGNRAAIAAVDRAHFHSQGRIMGFIGLSNTAPAIDATIETPTANLFIRLIKDFACTQKTII